MQVEGLLLDAAQRAPDKVAIVAQGSRHTYRELDRRSNQLAHALLAAGIERGDRVAIFLDNSVDVVIALFAALKAGGVFLTINPTTKSDKVAFILNDCRAAGLISHARLEPVLRGISKPIASLRLLSLVGADGPMAPLGHARPMDWTEATRSEGKAASRPPDSRCIDVDLATIIYTSGSTGFPKGVMMTHLNVLTATMSITRCIESTADDIVLSVLPLSFDYGLYQVFLSAYVGATLVIEPSFAYPARILERLSDERVTGFPIIPTMAAILLQMKGLAPGRFPHLRYVTNTAAELAPAHIRALRNLFPTTKLYSMYGLTECKRVAYLPPELLERKPTSVGIAFPNTEVYIVDLEDRRVGPGVVGELVVRGSHVMKGYWEREEETSRALRPGPLPGERVLYTGDLFSMDEDGCLYFVGRKDDIIKTRGEKVSPKEVEAVLYALPEVVEAAVVGVPDPILGEAVKAVVVLRKGAGVGVQEVLRHCASHLESFMVPKIVEFRDSLPQTATGKTDTRELRLGPQQAST